MFKRDWQCSGRGRVINNKKKKKEEEFNIHLFQTEACRHNRTLNHGPVSRCMCVCDTGLERKGVQTRKHSPLSPVLKMMKTRNTKSLKDMFQMINDFFSLLEE